MKGIFTRIAIITLVFGFQSAMAQLEVNPTPVEVTGSASQFEMVGYSFVINNGPDTTFCTWYRNVVAMTDGWESAVCDKNICHSWPVSFASFWLAPGEQGTLDVHAYPLNNVGSAIIEVSVVDDNNVDNNALGVYYFNESVSVPELLNHAIALFPNPATDFVQIEDGNEVMNIEFFDLSGKKVLSSNLNNSNAVNISSLSTGTYVARMFDAEGNMKSSNVLMKQ